MTTLVSHAPIQLAIDGGSPIRTRPWPQWPDNTDAEWRETVEPAFREVYLSGAEGLPGPKAAAFGEAMAGYCGARHGLLMPHGTDAIAMSAF